MSQTPEEQANLATWASISGDVKRLGIEAQQGMAVENVTQAIAQARGFAPEVVMDALLEGVQQGVLSIEHGRVRYRN